jgi:calcineurin-like phosphoesterase family protein
MNEKLIENWNSVVGKNDRIFQFGDFAFCNRKLFLDLIKRLNGKITIILGNHDKTVINCIPQLKDMKIDVVYYKEIKYNKNLICLFHYGQRVWNKSHHGSWHLYGHSHNKLPPHGKSVDVGVDSTWITGKAEYRPFSVEEIAQFMSTREIAG